jgi:hypothetical protein
MLVIRKLPDPLDLPLVPPVRVSTMSCRAAVLTVLAVWLVSCENHSTPIPVTPKDDGQVISVAVQDFANWKGATFGDREGILEVDAETKADPNGTANAVKSWAHNIAGRIDNDLIDAFVRRNRSGQPVAALITGSAWVRIREPGSQNDFPWDLPKGAKAVGTLTLPGFSSDGSRALLLIHHTWSIHGAIVTYVLSKQGGVWHVVARDQVVFL